MPGSFDLVAPRADALMESLRATGYSLPDAVCDIIDNCITAGARNIWLNFHWAGADSWVSILDDGRGMSEAGLIDAMRIGSRSPREVREPSDLGRYGLGLKTASISQARSLTVATHVAKQSGMSTRQWDLDHLASTGDWQLLNAPADVATEDVKRLSKLDQGTLVVWNKLDRLVGDVGTDNTQARRQFHDALRAVEEHVAMIFHRFMVQRNLISIWLNGQEVRPWDPFSRTTPQHSGYLPKRWDSPGPKSPSPLCAAASLPSERREASDGGRPGRLECTTGILCLSKPSTPPARRLAWARFPEGRNTTSWHASKSIFQTPSDHEWDIDVRKSRARSTTGATRIDLRRIAPGGNAQAGQSPSIGIEARSLHGAYAQQPNLRVAET